MPCSAGAASQVANWCWSSMYFGWCWPSLYNIVLGALFLTTLSMLPQHWTNRMADVGSTFGKISLKAAKCSTFQSTAQMLTVQVATAPEGDGQSSVYLIYSTSAQWISPTFSNDLRNAHIVMRESENGLNSSRESQWRCCSAFVSDHAIREWITCSLT